MNTSANALELKNVTVVYGENTPFRKVALKDVNVCFPAGTVTVDPSALRTTARLHLPQRVSF